MIPQDQLAFIVRTLRSTPPKIESEPPLNRADLDAVRYCPACGTRMDTRSARLDSEVRARVDQDIILYLLEQGKVTEHVSCEAGRLYFWGKSYTPQPIPDRYPSLYRVSLLPERHLDKAWQPYSLLPLNIRQPSRLSMPFPNTSPRLDYPVPKTST